jgi:DNA replication protein DnaC
MKENILRELRAEYETQRAANRAEEARRMEEAVAADPQIGALDGERRRLFQTHVAAAFADPARAQATGAELTESVRRINQSVRARLVQAGFPADHLQPVYRCPVCRDQGYVGEPVREMCTCLRDRLYGRLCAAGGLGIQPEERFETWDDAVFDDAPTPEVPQGQRAYMARVRALCEAYADDFPKNEKRNLLFTGSSGLGKTFLLHCIGERLMARGYTPWKLTAYQLMALLRDAYFERGDPERTQLLMESPLLMIDDLGTEPMQENLTIPQLFHLLNERQVGKRHTIISSNLTPSEIKARYTERLASRLLDTRTTQFLRFLGRDVRLRMNRSI